MVDHGIPAIDRAVDVLDCLASRSAPMSIREITDATGLVRTTVYRSLNTLCARGLALQVSEKTYTLGPHLLKLARAVPQGLDLVAIARGTLDELAMALGTSVKLSIVDGSDALVVATAEGPGAYSITTQIGRRFPLHAGGASKLLLAYLPPERRRAYLAGPLRSFTARTLTNSAALERECGRIRETGLAFDNGEHSEGVCAIAAPVKDSNGDFIAAISVPYAAGVGEQRVWEIADAVAAAAAKLTARIMA